MMVATRNVDGSVSLGMCTTIPFQLFDTMSRLSSGMQSPMKTEKRPYEA
jgi:hypothetical protein